MTSPTIRSRKSFGFPFLITVALLVVATAIYYPFSPAGRQSRDMRKASAHKETLKSRISTDKRFADIRLGVGTQVALVIAGTAKSAEDLRDLERIVNESMPPVRIFWAVRIEEKGVATRPGN
jgi:hypothetical protein